MSEALFEQERPCLHCVMVELMDDFLLSTPRRRAN